MNVAMVVCFYCFPSFWVKSPPCWIIWLGCWAHSRCCSLGKQAVELFADSPQLPQLELGDSQAALAVGSADGSAVHKLQDSALAEGVRDHLGAPAFFAEQALSSLVVRIALRCASVALDRHTGIASSRGSRTRL